MLQSCSDGQWPKQMAGSAVLCCLVNAPTDALPLSEKKPHKLKISPMKALGARVTICLDHVPVTLSHPLVDFFASQMPKTGQ